MKLRKTALLLTAAILAAFARVMPTLSAGDETIIFEQDFEKGAEVYNFSGGSHSAVTKNLYTDVTESGNTFGRFHASASDSNDDYRRVGMDISSELTEGIINVRFRFRKTEGKSGFIIIGDESAKSGEYNWLSLLFMKNDGSLYSGCGYGGALLKSECALKTADGAAASIKNNVWYNYSAEIDLGTRSLSVAVTESSGAAVGSIRLRNLNRHGNNNKDFRYVDWPYTTNFKRLATMFTAELDDIKITSVDDLILNAEDTGGTTRARAAVTVRNAEAGDKSLILAQYDKDGGLVSVNVSSKNLAANKTARLSNTQTIADSAQTVKAMLWDMKSVKPLCNERAIHKDNGKWPVDVDERGLDDPLSVSVTSERSGNIFDGDDSKILYLNLKNNTGYALDASLRYDWYNHDGTLTEKGGTLDIDVEGRGDGRYTLPVPNSITAYDTYYLEITRKVSATLAGDEYNMEYEPARYDFSIMNKLDEGEEPNRAIRTNSHHGIGWGDPDIVLSMARDAGFSGIRDEIRWHQAETVKGVYTAPTGKRDWITSAEKNGLGRLWILDYSNTLYTDNVYAFPDDSRFSGSEQAFLNYVDWITKTYKGRIDYYQLWNEPDTAGFNPYGNTAQKVQAYVNMLKKVYPLIKKNDPNAKVVGLSVSRNGYNFALAAMMLGAGDWMDAISFHPYQAETKKFSGEQHIQTINDMKALFRDKPILITEMGIAAYPEGNWPNEYMAAAQTVQMWAISQAEESVEAVYAFHFLNNYPSIPWDKAESEQQRWGLINHENETVPYSARPGAIAAAAYNKLIGNAAAVHEYSQNADSSGHKTYIYHFKRESDGKDVLIYWTEYGSQTVKIKLGAAEAQGYDINSNPTGTNISDNGVFTLKSSYKPSYLIGEFPEFEAVG